MGNDWNEIRNGCNVKILYMNLEILNHNGGDYRSVKIVLQGMGSNRNGKEMRNGGNKKLFVDVNNFVNLIKRYLNETGKIENCLESNWV